MSEQRALAATEWTLGMGVILTQSAPDRNNSNNTHKSSNSSL